jgi:hypothetical protein
MSQIGVASTGSRRQARRNRSFTLIWYYAGWSGPAYVLGLPVLSVSPILLRPIREQQEHDRVTRQLQSRWRRRFEVGANAGSDEVVPVRSGSQVVYPDLVLTSTVSGRRLHGVVEVETASSVNHLEAMAQWGHFAKVRGAFYLYVPAGLADVAQRLCEATKAKVTEIWVYYAIGSQAKFSMSYRSPRARVAAKAAKNAPPKRKVSKKAASKTVTKAVRKATKKKQKTAPKTTARKKAAKKQSATKRTVKATTRQKAKTPKQKASAKRVGQSSAKRKSLAGRKK